MSIRNILEAEAFYELQAYRSGVPSDAVAFVGSPRKHPYDEEKCVLVSAPFDTNPSILEFRIADIVHVDDLPSPVTADGESLPVVKLWIKRGSFGIRYEPFEVDSPLRFMNESESLRERLSAGPSR